MLQRMYTLEEAAELARRSPNALRVLRAKGRGPTFVKVDGRLLVTERDLAAWLDPQLANAGTDPQND